LLNSYANAFLGQVAYASADPLIQIDPTFLANNPGLSLDFSAGIENGIAGAVPEPSTWAMMILGFAGLGLMGYPRSRKIELATA
jgi:hypothetical protein